MGSLSQMLGHLRYNIGCNDVARNSALEVDLKPTAIATCIAMVPAGSGLRSTCLHARPSEEEEFCITQSNENWHTVRRTTPQSLCSRKQAQTQ